MISHMGAVVSHDGSKKLVAVILGINILDTIMGPGLIEIRMKRRCSETRLDTRPIPVADGWAGAKMRVFTLSNSITMTDGRTDGRTKPFIELRVRN